MSTQSKQLNLSTDDIIRIFELDKIPDDVLKSIAIDFRFFPRKFGIRTRIDESSNVILEDAKRTLTPDEVKNELRGAFYMDSWQIRVQKGHNKIDLLIFVSLIGKNREMIIDALTNFGWFYVGEKILHNRVGDECVVLNFEPMFQEDISGVLKELDKILHWTPAYLIDEITKNGLSPKAENKLGNHQPAVFFMSGNMPYPMVMILGKGLCVNNKDPRNDGMYILLSVNTCDVRGIPFFYDPNAENSFYTKETISPEIIHKEFGVDFKNDKMINV